MDSQLSAVKPHPQIHQDDPSLLQIDNGVIQLHSEKEVIRNIEELYTKFTCLVVIVRTSFKTLITTSGKHTVDDVSLHAKEFLKQPISSSSIDKVFDDIQPHYDFLNFGIIKSLVNQYFPEKKELQTKLTEYVDSVSNFLKFSQIKHVRSAINEKLPHIILASPCTSDQTKPIVIKLNELWDNMTIGNFKRVLQYYFEPEITDLFSYISIMKGSVIITLLIPTTQTQHLIDTINLKTNSMNRLGIIEIAVGAVNNAIFIRREGDNNFNASLHQSVKAGNSFEVSVLLQLGANPNIKDEEGKYPIEIAREGGHIKVIQTLLTGGAIDSKLNDDSHTLQ